VRTLAYTILVAGAMLIHAGPAAAQAPESVRPPVILTTTAPLPPIESKSPVAVLGRLLSFDANKDHQITRDELPERMQGLIARGDRNGNGVLDMDEIHGLVNSAAAGGVRVSFRPQPFDGLAGVVSDLKLAPEKHERALAIVSAHKPTDSVPANRPGNATEPRTSDMYKEMRLLLDDEEYENFVAAATRLSKTAQLRRGVVSGVVGR